MSASPGDKLQVNLKTSHGTLINLYAEDAAQLSGLLEDLEGIAPQITAAEEVFRAVAAAAPIAAPQQAAPFDNSNSSNSAAPQCSHGARVWKAGTGAKGPWSAWMCAAQKGDPSRCEPVWN